MYACGTPSILRLGLIVPVADMMNHGFKPTINFRLAPSGATFEFFAVGQAKKGEELLISYGENLTNRELMLTYGFTAPGRVEGARPLTPLS